MLTREQALSNKATFDSLADVYRRNNVTFAAEQKLPSLYNLAEADMLDLGVGAGRTAEFFAPLVKSYVGVDYSETMVATCRNRLKYCRFLCMDAQKLGFPAYSFDFVLFSFNGIDYVEFESRQAIFDEVQRVLRPGGCFLFSSHSLNPRPEASEYDMMYLNDGTHNGRLLTFYGTKDYQVREIESHGFEVEQVMGLDGFSISPGEKITDYCLHYLCKKK